MLKIPTTTTASRSTGALSYHQPVLNIHVTRLNGHHPIRLIPYSQHTILPSSSKYHSHQLTPSNITILINDSHLVVPNNPMEAPKEGPIPIIVENYDEERVDRFSSMTTSLLEPSLCTPCFSLPCFRHPHAVISPSSSSSFWERIGSSHYDNRWWTPGLRAIKKIREWSELIAGPKWKTFIRRKGCRTPGGVVGSAVVAGRGGGGKFNYDMVNYSLNFDEYHGNFDDEDEFRRLRSFSVGYGKSGEGEAEDWKKGKDAAGFAAA